MKSVNNIFFISIINLKKSGPEFIFPDQIKILVLPFYLTLRAIHNLITCKKSTKPSCTFNQIPVWRSDAILSGSCFNIITKLGCVIITFIVTWKYYFFVRTANGIISCTNKVLMMIADIVHFISYFIGANLRGRACIGTRCNPPHTDIHL